MGNCINNDIEYLDVEKILKPFLEDIHRMSRDYQNAEPYPHIVIDHVFPEKLLRKVAESFPDNSSVLWANRHEPTKKLSSTEMRLPDNVARLIVALNSGHFIDFIEKLTGISWLIPDVRLEGGGMHRVLRGGTLPIHADFNKQSGTFLDRRLNVLIYLNEDWKPEFGGHLELWDREMKECVRQIAPVFNRMVVFSTTSETYHGHPDPLSCPPDRSRDALALYFYTNGRPSNEVSEPHSTVIKQRPKDRLNYECNSTQWSNQFVKTIVQRAVAFFSNIRQRNSSK